MRTFTLVRHEDVNGVSGTGIVATGVQFNDGATVIRWLSDTPSTVVWNSIEDALAVHSHGGKTEIRWTSESAESALTPLHRVADLVASGLEYIRIQVYQGVIDVMVFQRENWVAWITALHGSPDGVNAATRKEWQLESSDWQWRWWTPDGQILINYLAKETPEGEQS